LLEVIAKPSETLRARMEIPEKRVFGANATIEAEGFAITSFMLFCLSLVPQTF